MSTIFLAWVKVINVLSLLMNKGSSNRYTYTYIKPLQIDGWVYVPQDPEFLANDYVSFPATTPRGSYYNNNNY